MHYSKLLKTNNIINADVDSTSVSDIELSETILDDDEITKVLSELLRLQEEYFSDIPLAEELCKNFMWNIPREVYNAFITAKTYDEPLILNPIALFYIFCTETPEEAMGKFVKTLMASIDDDGHNRICELSDGYDIWINDQDVEEYEAGIAELNNNE